MNRAMTKHSRRIRDTNMMYLDARQRYNDAIADMILAGIKKLEAFVKSSITKSLEKAAAELKKAADGDMGGFKRAEKQLNSAARTVKICIKISEGLLKIAKKLGA